MKQQSKSFCLLFKRSQSDTSELREFDDFRESLDSAFLLSVLFFPPKDARYPVLEIMSGYERYLK